MAYNLANARSRILISKAATIADWDSMQPFLNSSAWTLDANGASVTSAGSSGIVILAGGFSNQKITASLKFITPTTTTDIGVLARYYTNRTGYATYYYARLVGTNFRIGKNVDGTFSTLTSTSFTLAQNTWATFILQVSGSALSASIDDGTTSASLSTTDSAIAGPGGFGFRSGPTNSSTISCRSFTVEEV